MPLPQLLLQVHVRLHEFSHLLSLQLVLLELPSSIRGRE